VVPEKGGHLTALALGAKVADKVAYRAVAQAELLGDLRHRAALDKKGPQNFVAALQKLVGFEEKLLAEKVVVHDLPSECVTELLSGAEGNRNDVGAVGTRPSNGPETAKPRKNRTKCV
jgi:hypothetical protein